jgi:hypothetical protein
MRGCLAAKLRRTAQIAGILLLHAEAGKRIVCGGPNQFHMRGWVQG